MSRPGLGERTRYWFDNTMARGTPALIGWLGLASLGLIVLVTVLAVMLAPGDVNGHPLQVLWMSLLRTLDPGTMGGDQGSAVFLGLMLAVTVGGIFIVSSLVGVLATGLDGKLAELRKGRSRVVERGHTVVLGWSDQIFTIISELVKANEGERACVTILADRDKIEMEDEIRSRLHRTGKVRIVCRTGSPTEPTDVEIVRPDEAGVIMLPEPSGEDGDIRLIKTLLALRNRPWPQGRPPAVAAVSDSSNLPAAVLAGGPSVHVIDAEDITARLVVQSRRHPGLSVVCAELLSFDGDEIYMRAEPSLAGSTYRDALLAYETATVIGLRRPDGTVEINPPAEAKIQADDEVILLASTASSIRLAETRTPAVTTAISDKSRPGNPPERTLMLGWNDRAAAIIGLLDRYLPPGSTVTVAAARPSTRLADAELPELGHLTIETVQCEPTDRAALESLRPGQFQHVIVLAEDNLPPGHADSRTLVTLLHLRDMKEKAGDGYAIVSELNDDANRRLAQVTRADDFVVGTKLISLLLTQLASNQHLAAVFSELFDAQGSDIYLKPADRYLVPGVEANFATVIEAAARHGETAIGYRLKAGADQPPRYGVALNPDKAQPLALSAEDRVVVLARD